MPFVFWEWREWMTFSRFCLASACVKWVWGIQWSFTSVFGSRFAFFSCCLMSNSFSWQMFIKCAAWVFTGGLTNAVWTRTRFLLNPCSPGPVLRGGDCMYTCSKVDWPGPCGAGTGPAQVKDGRELRRALIPIHLLYLVSWCYTLGMQEGRPCRSWQT